MAPPMQCSGNKLGCLKKAHTRSEGPRRMCEVCEAYMLAARYRGELLKLLGPLEGAPCPCGISATEVDFEMRGGKKVCIGCGLVQGEVAVTPAPAPDPRPKAPPGFPGFPPFIKQEDES